MVGALASRSVPSRTLPIPGEGKPDANYVKPEIRLQRVRRRSVVSRLPRPALRVSPAACGSIPRGSVPLDGPDEQLGHVDDLERLLGRAGVLLLADGVAEHHKAKRAGGGDLVGIGEQGLVHPFGVDTL